VFKRILLCLLASIFCVGQSKADEGILVKTNPKKYQVRISVELKTVIAQPDAIVVALPLPESNEYQTIRWIKALPEKARVFAYPENGEKYLACPLLGHECPLPGASTTVFHEFEVALYDLSVDFTKIEKIHPYNKTTALYRRYTGKSGNMIDPQHAEIKRIAAQISKESKDALEFARNAYVYVSDHYKYLNPNVGLTPLDQLLRDGGGDCGNLSSIYISLLRNHGIPARHVVAIRPNGTYHVWAEFYLERYGWIPVDVTYRLENKRGNYFGRVRVGTNGIIVSRDVDLSVASIDGKLQKVRTMQTYAYWYAYRSQSLKPGGKIECNLSVTSQPIE
jgi:transglutaminase-like putative cysteine protease